MRQTFTLALFSGLALAAAVQAETWKPYSAESPNHIQWSYDADYSYRDAATGRVVALQAVGKVGAEPRMGPSAPGAADGVGSLVAIDCQKGDMILISGYSPKKPLDVPAGWRKTASRKIDGDDDKALMAGVCANAAALPTK